MQDIELAGGAVPRGVVRATGGQWWRTPNTLLDAAGTVVDTATTGSTARSGFIDLSAASYTVIASGYRRRSGDGPPDRAGGGQERGLEPGYED